MIFGKWFNHLALYTAVWYMMLALYEIKLMEFVDIKPMAWISLTGAYISFFLGSITVFVARKCFNKPTTNIEPSHGEIILFADDGRIIKYALLFFSLTGLFGVIYQWIALIHKFGSITAVIVQANLLYRMRVEGKLVNELPYVFVAAFAGVFLSGIYSAYKNRLTWLSLIPIIAVILKDISNAGRAGMLTALLIFIASFFLYRHIASEKVTKKSRTGLLISAAIILGLIIGGAVIVKSSRGTIENYAASSKQLNKLKNSLLISPSIYLYFSSHVGVYSEYIEHDFDEDKYMFGEFTFQPFYNILAKFGMVETPPTFDKGYFIPMYTNTSTYLKPLHGDFGNAGLYVVPFLLGLTASFYWYRLYEKKKGVDLAILSFLYVLIMYSYITILSRYSFWTLSLIMLVFVIPFMERLIERKIKVKKILSGSREKDS
ncbi:MAG: oligosaccharide repeat unit polymerase [Ignavibacteria bacterium]|jgi:oligosaccharide repeat unit polymerase|nr:oligosaccharide repeat unit polymerase [Ignavibacteria bacterium]MCU7503125.1 oligosaccharide repeat unit polymerase [Ignavibacteria bacterium]MCU7518419.1 oligosaccharide repeat unit polymerase [Ignavibacteria bacterium]